MEDTDFMSQDGRRYLSVLFEEEVIKEIDDFRFKHRVESRTEAIRRMILYSLKHQAGAAKTKSARKPKAA